MVINPPVVSTVGALIFFSILKIVQDLNGEVVESVYDCTHLVTDKVSTFVIDILFLTHLYMDEVVILISIFQVRRTVKFLCCLSRGIPVVSKKWLTACKKAKSFVGKIKSCM